MKLYYDLHTHSCLSPCGSEDMTPNNLINMASLCGLNIVALTDHNSCKNCPAAARVAEQVGITFLPGMELCTAEEIHVVCLFPTVEQAMAFDAEVERCLLPIRNKTESFGHQSILNEKDEKIGEYPWLLTAASTVSIDQVPWLVAQFGGVAFPAHIDRASYSILSALGDVPPLGFTAAEVTDKGDVRQLCEKHQELRGMTLLMDSDAHDLEVMGQPLPYLELPDDKPQTIIGALRGEVPFKHSRG